MSDEKKIEVPNIIVRHRTPEGTIDRTQRIDRYWKHKVTGTTVEARRFLRVVPENEFKVVFFDADLGVELSLPLDKMRAEYEPIGNLSSKF
jgi:hypothetical protein